MSYAVENLRLRELAIVAEQNKAAFDDFVQFLGSRNYPSLHAWVTSADELAAEASIVAYFERPLPIGLALYDGIARPYAPDKAKWLLLGWILRDAPEQRLRPMLSSMPGASINLRRAHLINRLRVYIAGIFPEPSRWDWNTVSEVIIDRLEGSRRAIKGTLFEAIVRRHIAALLVDLDVPVSIGETEIRLGGETYDVSVVGRNGQILIPVKTRETMGGGHSMLFTRDIHKSISAAQEAGFDCLPVIIAESWGGDLTSLACKDHIYINMNPNQVVELEPVLAAALASRRSVFEEIM